MIEQSQHRISVATRGPGFTDITAEVDLPVVVHPVGKTTAAYGVGLPASAVRRVCEEVPQVVGWKMTYNYDGYRMVTRTLRELNRPVAILGAVAKYFHENLASDAFDGTASGGFNYALEPMLDHILSWRRAGAVRATDRRRAPMLGRSIADLRK